MHAIPLIRKVSITISDVSCWHIKVSLDGQDIKMSFPASDFLICVCKYSGILIPVAINLFIIT